MTKKKAPATKKRGRGRPSEYKPETVDKICQGVAEGKSLTRICAEEGMPGTTTVFRWLQAYNEFREQYVRARETRADARMESIDDVVADMRAGTIDAQQARVQIEAIKWQMGKEAPTRYGDRQEIHHSGSISLQKIYEDVTGASAD